MNNTHTDSSNTYMQLMTVTLVIAGIRNFDIEPAMNTVYMVDPYARSTHKTVDYRKSSATDVLDLTATLTLSLQDAKFMEKYRQAMFKLRLQYPNVHVQNTY